MKDDLKESTAKRNSSKAPDPAEQNPFEEIRGIIRNHLERFQYRQNEEHRDVLSRANDAISKSVSQMTELVEMLHHFRTMNESKVNAVRRPADTSLQEMVPQLLQSMQAAFPMNKITVLKIIPNDLAPIPVPPEHFETILFHLLYYVRETIGDRAGIITIEASERKRERLQTLEQSQRYFEICVSYTYPGMTSADLIQAFDPFRENELNDNQSKFGLFVVKKLVEHHQGEIRLQMTMKNTSFLMEFLNAPA